jgi:hypothetical protein
MKFIKWWVNENQLLKKENELAEEFAALLHLHPYCRLNEKRNYFNEPGIAGLHVSKGSEKIPE